MFLIPGVPQWMLWTGFLLIIFIFLALDLGIFHKKNKTVSIKEAVIWSIVWFTMAMIFNAFIWYYAGSTTALEFFTGYIIEKSLSVDNLFVILMIFTSFHIAAHLQHKALFYGILGALVFRGVLIGVGSVVVNTFNWVLYIFGAFLVLTGIKFFFETEKEFDHEKHIVVRWAKKIMPVSTDLTHERFFVREGEKLAMTVLFLAVVVIEFSDIIFAFDSIPAIFAITTDPFIVFTSNVFAILGLRSLYFVVAKLHDLFVHLKYGLAIILIFVGTKMLIAHYFHIPIGVSLGVVFGVLVTTIITSIMFHKKEPVDYKHE